MPQAAVGDKTAVDLTLEALEDSAAAVNEAAIGALIALGDVFDLDPGREVRTRACQYLRACVPACLRACVHAC